MPLRKVIKRLFASDAGRQGEDMTWMTRISLATLAVCLASVVASQSATAVTHFQQYRNGVCEREAGFCGIPFNTVPAGKTLEITNTSCYVRGDGPMNIYSLQLEQRGPSGNAGTAVTLVPFHIDTLSNGEEVFQSNDQVLVRATAGQHFYAHLQKRSGIVLQFACHISGRMLP
jgi:hypothetical protein